MICKFTLRSNLIFRLRDNNIKYSEVINSQATEINVDNISLCTCDALWCQNNILKYLKENL